MSDRDVVLTVTLPADDTIYDTLTEHAIVLISAALDRCALAGTVQAPGQKPLWFDQVVQSQ